MKAFQRIFGVALAAALVLSLSACMNNGGTANPQATTQTSFMPEATATAPGANTTQQPAAFDWATGAGQIEANVSRLSEISDCRVVVTGTTALVGVKFASAYQGEVTERIREMVAAKVMKADPAIQTVAVTAENDDVTKVYELSDKVRGGEPADTLGDQINEIVRNATTLR